LKRVDLVGVKSGEDGEASHGDESTKRAMIYQHLAFANQEDFTPRREKVENQTLRPTPREQIQ